MKPIILTLAMAGLAAAQIGYPYPPVGYPGGYPPGYPGGYPGGNPGGYPPGTPGGTGAPAPRGKPNKTQDQPQVLPNFRGKLKEMDSKNLRLALDDSRVMEFRLTGKTKYLKKGEDLKSPKFNRDFNAGDQMSVEASEAPDGSLTAVNVYWERGAADVVSSNEKKDGGVDAWKTAPRDPNDPGPPVLKRSDSNGQASAPAQSSPQSAAASQAPPPAQSSDTAQTPLPPPRRPVTEDAAPPAPRDPGDPGPPVLKRGKPVQQASNEPPPPLPQPAQRQAAPPPAAPSHAAPPQATTPPAGAGEPPLQLPQVAIAPPATSGTGLPSVSSPGADDQSPLGSHEEDPLIRKASEAALQFTETLPNYVCQEMMSRFQSESQPVSWESLDVVGTEVVYENGRERYRNLTVNGKPVNKTMEQLGGSWSTGEFGTVLIDLFSPATDAQFSPRGGARIAGIDARLYSFHVLQPNSHWILHFGAQTYQPAYSGSVWIDPQNGRVLRIEMQANALPEQFPSDHVESATDYQYVRLGGAEQFLLPVHAETLSCQRGSSYCSRNTIDFRNYHKYAGESTIEFEGEKK